MSDTPAYDALELNHQRFVDALFLSPSASAAYTRVYLTEGASADVGASRLLRNDKVQAAVAEKRTLLAERTNISIARIVQEYARLGFSSMRQFASWGPDGVTLMDDTGLSEDDARCVAEVSQTITQHGGTMRLKLHEKKPALDKLVELLGITAEQVRRLYPGFDAVGLDAETRQARVFSILRRAKEKRDEETKTG